MRDDINDKKVLAIVARLEAARAPVNQCGELTRLIEAELQAAGYAGSDHQVFHILDDRIDHVAQRLTAAS